MLRTTLRGILRRMRSLPKSLALVAASTVLLLAGLELFLRATGFVDADATPDMRLANLVYQKRARWLLGHADELFVE